MTQPEPDPHLDHEPRVEHARHERQPDGPAHAPGGWRSGWSGFGVVAVVLCALLGVAIVTQARQTESGDSLETARPADLLVLLDSLQQREAALNSEVGDLQRTLDSLEASGSSDQAAIENAQSRLAALSILIGTVAATGPGVAITVADTAPGVSPETMLDVINELRAAGAEAMQMSGGQERSESGNDSGGQERSESGNDSGGQERSDSGGGSGGQERSESGNDSGGQEPGGPTVRIGVDTWVVGSPGALVVDGVRLSPPYSVLAIGDPATLAAAMNIPGGAMDSVERVGGTMSVRQVDVVNVTALRQPKPRQYAQPVK